jgi:tetratricopeptide (TPR) repeat protein
MKKSILTAMLALAAGVSGLMAQGTPPAAAPAAPAAPKGPSPKSQPELNAIQAMFQAQQQNNLDGVIKAADELMTKFADTEFKELALYMEAEAYAQKGDNTKAQLFSEQALAINPKSYQASIMLAELLAKQTRENDLDREEKLGKVEKYAKDSMEYVKDVPKPNPQVTDDQWAEFKKGIIARAHAAIGTAQLIRKKYDVAAAEFKLAADNDPQPAFLVKEASALQSAGKNDEAAALCDKVLADPNLHPMIKQVAQQIKSNAVKK